MPQVQPESRLVVLRVSHGRRSTMFGSALKRSVRPSAEGREGLAANPIEFRSVCLPHIPTAAWLCAIDRASPNPLLLHGASVLVWPHKFVEGGWAGGFEDLDFMSASFLSGSAG